MSKATEYRAMLVALASPEKTFDQWMHEAKAAGIPSDILQGWQNLKRDGSITTRLAKAADGWMLYVKGA